MDLSNENIIHVKKESIEYLQFKKLLEYKEIVHCYTLSINGINFKIGSKENEDSMLKLCNVLNIDKNSIVRPDQKHTDIVKSINELDEDLTNVDGLITNKKNINMFLSFADCTPILIYDPVKKVACNIHSGWKGTLQKIAQKGVLKMIKEYGTKAENLIVCIGPCIQKCHFEVSKDVEEKFEKTFRYLNRNNDIIKKAKEKEDKYLIDTTLINRLILEEVGIKKENIIDSKICTVCNADIMHSYRVKKEDAGRNVSVLGLKKE